MKITFGSKTSFHKAPCQHFQAGYKRYELGLWCTNLRIVDNTKLHLPSCEWLNYLVPCVQIGISLIVFKGWINVTCN